MLHTIVMSDTPLNRNYRQIKGILIDKNLLDVSDDIISLLKSFNIKYVSLKRDFKVGGRSWEMSATMSLLGRPGCYTGEIEYITDKIIKFGTTPGVDSKRKVNNSVLTALDVDSISLSR